MKPPVLMPPRPLALTGPVKPRRPVPVAGAIDRNLFCALFPTCPPPPRRSHGAIVSALRGNAAESRPDSAQLPPDRPETGNNRR